MGGRILLDRATPCGGHPRMPYHPARAETAFDLTINLPGYFGFATFVCASEMA